ncbi:hypothetical protein [Nostoc linckia]|uniref:hypothetical protein n=1 Tax=Nostoc linckia TaxID=92942 RepID=UPI0015D4D552|nr:hypothetical protein [Nostoc linckia]
MGRWGDGEMGRWGDGEMGRWGDEFFSWSLFCPMPHTSATLSTSAPCPITND